MLNLNSLSLQDSAETVVVAGARLFSVMSLSFAPEVGFWGLGIGFGKLSKSMSIFQRCTSYSCFLSSKSCQTSHLRGTAQYR